MGLIVDLFAGGGGASLGIKWATGREPDIAINHDPLALAMHAANHPTTKHIVENVWHVRPLDIIGKRKVDILWASPDCTHFSKAKGSAPRRDINRAKRSRGLAWVILRWALHASPTVIFMENVEEWIDWCPLRKDGTPDPKRKGETRKRFVRQLKKLGYAVEIVEKDRACDHGAPTIRQRLFMIARNDGQPIHRPMPTHGPKDGVRDLFGGAVKPYRTAAEIIDWSLRCPSIFTRKKELAPATKRRIARGMVRYVVDAADPFIVPITHQGDNRVHGIHEPLRTVTTANRGELALAMPFIARVDQSSAAHKNGIQPMTEPTRTVTSSGVGALVTPFLAGAGGPEYQGKPRSINAPMGTIMKENHTALVAPILTKFRADNVGQRLDEPAPTVTANSFVKRPGGSVPIGLATAVLVNTRNGERDGQEPRSRDVGEPYPTVTAHGSQGAVAAAFMAKHFGGHETDGAPLGEPVSTVTTRDHHALVAASIVKLKGTSRDGQPVTEPLATVQTGGNRGGGHHAITSAFLAKSGIYGGHNGLYFCGPIANRGRDISRRRGRINLAAESHLGSSWFAEHLAEARGMPFEERLSGLEVLNRREAILSSGPSLSLDVSSRCHSGWHGYQPLEWRQDRQFPVEHGVGVARRQSPPRVSNRAARPSEIGPTAIVTGDLRRSPASPRNGDVILGDRKDARHLTNGCVPRAVQVNAFLQKYYSEGGQDQPITDPVHTLTTKARLSLVTTEAGTFPMTDEEIAGARKVAKFMAEYANDNRFNGKDFVCVKGIPIVDIGMRMLSLRELYRAQGFPDSYVIDPVVERIVRGKLVRGPLPKTDGTRMCGNSVSPYHAAAYVGANPLRARPQKYKKAA